MLKINNKHIFYKSNNLEDANTIKSWPKNKANIYRFMYIHQKLYIYICNLKINNKNMKYENLQPKVNSEANSYL